MLSDGLAKSHATRAGGLGEVWGCIGRAVRGTQSQGGKMLANDRAMLHAKLGPLPSSSPV